MRNALAVLAVLAVLVFLLACGGGGSGGPDGGADGGGSSGDGGTVDAAQPTHAGFVSIQSYDAKNSPGTPTRGGTSNAAFYTDDASCTTQQQIGACDVAQCPTATPGGAQSAGTITITGAATPIAMVPAVDKTYPMYSSTAPLFSGGESITFTAAGADIPAFAKAITTPSKLTITSPAEPSSQSPYLIVDRSRAFTVSWSGGGTGRAQIVLFDPSDGTRITCRFAASAGTGTVPAAALGALAAGTGGFAMAAIEDVEHVAGDWAVSLSAYYNAIWPDASIASGPTMLR